MTSTSLWEDLVPELLSLIAEGLGIVDLLSFRGVCRSWRASASLATASIESSPWFLIHSDIKSKCLTFSGQCGSDCKDYYITIPELKGATCLASSEGWLLLSNNQDDSIFFLCPFSRRRIDLPRLPLQLSHRVAAFSSPPTSKDCTVCIPHRNKETGLELLTLSRGQHQWDRLELGYTEYDNEPGVTLCATACLDGVISFYILDVTRSGNLVPCPREFLKCTHAFCRYHQVSTPEWDELIKEWLGCEDDIALSTCGTVLLRKALPKTDQYRDICIVIKTLTADSDSSNKSHVNGILFHPRFYEQLQIPDSW